MDFIVSYQLYSQIKKKEREGKEREGEEREGGKEEREELKEYKSPETRVPRDIINKNCSLCGQNQYFCQCKNNVKTMFKYFNPEKDIY